MKINREAVDIKNTLIIDIKVVKNILSSMIKFMATHLSTVDKDIIIPNIGVFCTKEMARVNKSGEKRRRYCFKKKKTIIDNISNRLYFIPALTLLNSVKSNEYSKISDGTYCHKKECIHSYNKKECNKYLSKSIAKTLKLSGVNIKFYTETPECFEQ